MVTSVIRMAVLCSIEWVADMILQGGDTAKLLEKERPGVHTPGPVVHRWSRKPSISPGVTARPVGLIQSGDRGILACVYLHAGPQAFRAPAGLRVNLSYALQAPAGVVETHFHS